MTALSSSTAVSLFVSSTNDLATSFYSVIVPILVILVALIGLGFAWRKITKHVTGKKF